MNIIEPLDISDIDILKNTVTLIDGSANFGFKFFNYCVYKLSVNVSSATSGSILQFPYAPIDYVRIVFSTNSSMSFIPYVFKDSGQLTANASFPAGEYSFFIIYKTS